MARPKLTTPNFELRRRRGKPYWYVTWSHNGRTAAVSTGTEDAVKAQQFLLDYKTSWLAPAPSTELTINEILDKYLKYKKSQYVVRGEDVEHSKSNYKKLAAEIDHNKAKKTGTPPSIREFFGFMRISQLSRQLGRDYTMLLKKMGRSNASIAKRLSVLNAAINYGFKEGLIAHQPVTLQLPPPPPPRDKIMSTDNVRDFLNATAAPHLQIFCLLALHTLARKSAILDLTWDQIDLDARTIDYNTPGRIATRKRRVKSGINDTLYMALKVAALAKKTKYVIEWRGQKIRDIGAAFKAVADRAELSWVTPHVMRHTGASHLASQGVPIEKIAELMGDSVETARKHYIKYSPDFLTGATNKLDEIYR